MQWIRYLVEATCLIPFLQFSSTSDVFLLVPISRVCKLHNFVDEESTRYFLSQNYEKIYTDLISEVLKICPIVKGFIVDVKRKCVGGEVGSIFIELSTIDQSEQIIKNLSGKLYDKKEIKIVCVPEESYVKYFLPHFQNN